MKKRKEKKHTILFIALVACVMILIPLLNIQIIITNRDLLYKELVNLNINDNFEDKSYPYRALTETWTYLMGYNKGLPRITGFNDTENAHMNDVKILIDRIIMLEIVLIFLWFILFLKFVIKKDLLSQLGRILFYSGGCLIVLIVFFIIVSIFAFDYAFIIFHRIFFTGETWLFPADSTIIKLFPAQFFQNILIKIIIDTGITAVVLFFVGFFIIKFKRLK